MSLLLLEPLRGYATKSSIVIALRVMFLIGLAATSARAQMGGIDPDPGDRGTGGRNTIQGRIFLPGGRKLDIRVKVRLQSSTGYDRFQFSDDSGAFAFRRLQSGSYTVTVDAGTDFEIWTEPVDIIAPVRRQNDPGVSYTVTAMLQPKSAASTRKPGTIDASTGGAPEEALELYKHAVESANAGDRKKAVEQLKQALVIYPQFMTALNELGVQYIEMKEWEKAADALRKAIGIAPEAFHPRLNYGIVLIHLKDFKDAATQLSIAVQKDSSSGPAHFHLGRAMVSLGNYDAAEKALRQTISIGGEEAVEAHRYLAAVYIEKHDSARAADELNAYLKLAPKAKDADRIRAIVKDLRSQASATPR